MDALIYTKQACPHCDRAKNLLAARGVKFSLVDCTFSTALTNEMIARSKGRKTYPQVFLDGIHVGGADELEILDAAGGLIVAA